MEKNIALAFPTLIGRFRIPNAQDVNRRLRELVLDREKKEPNHQFANVGGWHSRGNFLETADPAIEMLKNWMAEGVQTMIAGTMEQMRAGGINRPFQGSMSIYAWANVSRRGNYHSMHNHPGSAWSGVYYVDTGGEAGPQYPQSGVIDLLDPRPFTEMVYTPGEPYGQKYPIRPDAGMMLLFPGFLYHFVHPHFGDGERISIAFNSSADRRTVSSAPKSDVLAR